MVPELHWETEWLMIATHGLKAVQHALDRMGIYIHRLGSLIPPTWHVRCLQLFCHTRPALQRPSCTVQC